MNDTEPVIDPDFPGWISRHIFDLMVIKSTEEGEREHGPRFGSVSSLESKGSDGVVDNVVFAALFVVAADPFDGSGGT
jgi:hypothetical protein